MLPGGASCGASAGGGPSGPLSSPPPPSWPPPSPDELPPDELPLDPPPELPLDPPLDDPLLPPSSPTPGASANGSPPQDAGPTTAESTSAAEPVKPRRFMAPLYVHRRRRRALA